MTSNASREKLQRQLQKLGLEVYMPEKHRGESPIKALFFGEPGTAKTLIAGTFEDCLLLDVDGGAQATLDSDYARKLGLHKKVEYIRVTDAKDIKKVIRLLKQNPGSYKSLAIDTISILTQNIIMGVLAGKKDDDDDVSDDEESVKMQWDDWGDLKNTLYELLALAVDLNMNVCVTAHTEDKEMANGKIRKGPSLQGKIREQAPAFFDFIGYTFVDYEGEKGKKKAVFKVQFAPTKNLTAKDRTGRLGSIVRNVTFDVLKKAFNEKVEESEDESLYGEGDDSTVVRQEVVLATKTEGGQQKTTEKNKKKKKKTTAK